MTIEKGLPFLITLALVGTGVYTLITMWSAVSEFSDFQVDLQDLAIESAQNIVQEVEDVEAVVSALVATVDAEISEPAASIGDTPEETAEVVAEVLAVQEEISEAVAEVSQEVEAPQPVVVLVIWDWRPTSEELFLWLVVAAGGLGAAVGSGAILLSQINADEDLAWKDTLRHLARAVAGAGAALLAYFGIRGGILNLNIDSANLNPYGIVFISAAVGMFVKRWTESLARMFG